MESREITPQSLGVIHVLVAGEPPEYRLPQQAGQPIDPTGVWIATGAL